jgi:quercetin dioxygenase-like cupin family protein
MNRRNVFQLAAAALGARLGANAQTKPATKSGTLLQQDLPKMDGKDWTVSLVNVEYPPGGGSESHRHPGPVVVYVLEGALVNKLDDGETITYKPGQTFYELPMHLHTIAKNASQTEPVKFLAFLITEKGKPLTVPK